MASRASSVCVVIVPSMGRKRADVLRRMMRRVAVASHRTVSHHTVSLRLVGWSVLVGVLGGAVVSAFRWLLARGLETVQWWYWGLPNHLWQIVPAVAGCLVVSAVIAGLITSQPLIKGSGIPDVERRLRGPSALSFPWWDVLWKKFIGGILAIGPGAFAGREGPSIQLGACVGMGLSDRTATTRRFRRELVAAGAAAGLAAAFNAPVAAVLFVAEEVYGRFSLQIGMSSFAAALASDAVAQQVFGLAPVFRFPTLAAPGLGEYGALAVLAVALGLGAWTYAWTVLRSDRWYVRCHIPVWLRAAVPLLLTMPVGLWHPVLLGGGNALINALGGSGYALPIVAGFLAVRFVVSQITYGSGSPGGIFLPILTLGALVGAVCGGVLGDLGWAGRPSIVPILIVAGMSGLFGAVSKAPLTAVVLVAEMTSFGVLMPLAFVTFIAYIIYDVLGGRPIYEALGGPAPIRP